MLDWQLWLEPATYLSLASLTLLEIVLGIDNVIFISILAAKLPEHQRQKARMTGLALAVMGRLLLLMSIAWLTQLTTPFLHVWQWHFSGKDLVLLAGGLFLIAKSAHEIYEKVEAPGHEAEHNVSVKAGVTFKGVIIQILLIDLVFSLDSIITAVGLVKDIAIMVVAIVIALAIMMATAKAVGEFVDQHPSVKILALSFLLMIGTLLTAEAFHTEIPKGYIYFSLTFAMFVEVLNIRANSRKVIHVPDDPVT